MDWSSNAHFRQLKQAPPCWACRHYEAKEFNHRCSIAMQGFPRQGQCCSAYRYEPGIDPAEAYQ